MRHCIWSKGRGGELPVARVGIPTTAAVRRSICSVTEMTWRAGRTPGLKFRSSQSIVGNRLPPCPSRDQVLRHDLVFDAWLAEAFASPEERKADAIALRTGDHSARHSDHFVKNQDRLR